MVLRLKQRPIEGMILVAADLSQLEGWVRLQTATPASARSGQLAGAHTWILPTGPRAKPWVTGEHSGIAVRISAHPLVAALCRAWGGLWSPPAPAWPETRRPAAVPNDPRLLRLLDGLLDGETGGLAQQTPIATHQRQRAALLSGRLHCRAQSRTLPP